MSVGLKEFRHDIETSDKNRGMIRSSIPEVHSNRAKLNRDMEKDYLTLSTSVD